MTAAAAFSPAVERDLEDAVRYVARTNVVAARKLQQALRDAAYLLGCHPEAGRRQPRLVWERFRIWSVTWFTYVVVYDPTPRPPEILRVLHTARDLPSRRAFLRDQ